MTRTRLRILSAVALPLLCAIPIAHGAATLGLKKTATPEPVRVGQDLTYRLAVTNVGPDTATNVVVTDALPQDTDFVSCQVSQGSYSNENGTLYAMLGNLARGATAAVTIVVLPTRPGVITNEASATAINSTGVRTSAVSTVQAANRPPEIHLPGPHTLPVGATTSFVVTVTDPDHDPNVTLTNTVKPAGATFNGTNFTWTATVGFVNTTNPVVFVANDGRGETNSIATNSTVIVVPLDSEGDGLPDDWEWTHFQTLTNSPTGDNDSDGADNFHEYVAGTQPTNAASVFSLNDVLPGITPTQHWVEVRTQPSRKYTIEFAHDLSGAWSTFSNLSNGVGTWLETNTVPSTYRFLDNEGAQTSGGPPPQGRRYYRVKVERP